MVYTVKKLSEISKVSVRTLHFYEEEGLLSPAYYGSNGYRYYEEEQLLQLQQILFFKELGFSIKKIREVIGKNDFNILAQLHSHKKALKEDYIRLGRLLKTVDKTIEHLNGKRKMKEEDFYDGFIVTKEKQKEYVAYLKNRLGESHPSLLESEKNIKNWTKAEWETYKKEIDEDYKRLAKLMESKARPDSNEVQAVIQNLHKWIKKFWTPNRESFIDLGKMYTEFEWKKFFEKHDPEHPKLALYLSEGMQVFAENNL